MQLNLIALLAFDLRRLASISDSQLWTINPATLFQLCNHRHNRLFEVASG